MFGNQIYPYLLFYRSNFVGSIILSLVCASTVLAYGGTVIAPACWIKIALYGITVWYVNTMNEHKWYFYKNLGIHKNNLWKITIGFDFILFMVLLILAY